VGVGFFDRIIKKRSTPLERAMDDLAESLSAGDPSRAIAAGREAVKLAEGSFGKRSAELAVPLYGLASALLSAGELDESASQLRRALDDLDPEPKTKKAGVSRAQLLEMLASVVLQRGDEPDRVESLLRRWVDASHAETPPDPARLATAMNQLGLFLGRRDKREEAVSCFERAAALRRDAFGPEHRTVAEALFNAASFRPKDRDPNALRDELLEVVRLARGDEPETKSLRASALHNLGAVLEELGRADEARDRYVESLTLRESLSGPDDVGLRPTLVRLAQLHHQEGRIVFALPLYERALVMARQELGPEHAIVKAIERWKGELLSGDD
jgi:tetratricopeptide (TPR) repeat protein